MNQFFLKFNTVFTWINFQPNRKFDSRASTFSIGVNHVLGQNSELLSPGLNSNREESSFTLPRLVFWCKKCDLQKFLEKNWNIRQNRPIVAWNFLKTIFHFFFSFVSTESCVSQLKMLLTAENWWCKTNFLYLKSKFCIQFFSDNSPVRSAVESVAYIADHLKNEEDDKQVSK